MSKSQTKFIFNHIYMRLATVTQRNITNLILEYLNRELPLKPLSLLFNCLIERNVHSYAHLFWLKGTFFSGKYLNIVPGLFHFPSVYLVYLNYKRFFPSCDKQALQSKQNILICIPIEFNIFCIQFKQRKQEAPQNDKIRIGFFVFRLRMANKSVFFSQTP